MNQIHLSPWAKEVIARYESGIGGCFLLHGNVGDRVVLPAGTGVKAKEASFGSLKNYLEDVLLPRFEVVITYGLGQGIRIERGGKIFSQWKYAQDGNYPVKPLEAIRYINEYLLYLRNAKNLGAQQANTQEGRVVVPRVAVIIRDAHLIVPAIPNALNYDLNALASIMRGWASEVTLNDYGQAAFLIAEQKNAVHPLISESTRVSAVEISLPSKEEIAEGLSVLSQKCGPALAAFEDDLAKPAERLCGATMGSVERLLKRFTHEGKRLESRDLNELKKQLVEEDCGGLIGFVEPNRNLDDVIGIEGVKKWLRQDLALWEQGEDEAMPMGYLFCGPVGTGKTYLAECLAGEAGVPVVTLKNFRDRWVGSTEANLEKIFSLLHALGRCIVFVDEADQALGKRNSTSGDSGVGSRVYSMMAKEMSNTQNRGKLLWVLASSRPDLIEVDLKRPGRIDVKLPLFPSTDPEEAFTLLRALCKKFGVEIPKASAGELLNLMPHLLTPGSAEAIAVKTYRTMRSDPQLELNGVQALKSCLESYRAPISPDVIKLQMLLAAQEATDETFVPDEVRKILDVMI